MEKESCTTLPDTCTFWPAWGFSAASAMLMVVAAVLPPTNASTKISTMTMTPETAIILFFIFAFIVLLFLRYQSGVDLPPRRPEKLPTASIAQATQNRASNSTETSRSAQSP